MTSLSPDNPLPLPCLRGVAIPVLPIATAFPKAAQEGQAKHEREAAVLAHFSPDLAPGQGGGGGAGGGAAVGPCAARLKVIALQM